MKDYKRLRYIIDKKLQFRLLIVAIFYLFGFIVVSGAILFIPMMIKLNSSEATSQQLYEVACQILHLHTYFWPTMLMGLVVVAIHSIWVSHKIAGPLYRFKLIFKAVKNGNLFMPGKLRKGDYLLNEMDIITEMIEGLRSRITEVQQEHARLAEAISGLRKAVSGGYKDEVMANIKALEEKEEYFGSKLAYFKIDSS